MTEREARDRLYMIRDELNELHDGLVNGEWLVHEMFGREVSEMIDTVQALLGINDEGVEVS